jgi:peptidoglycan/LPS O-acetylase OafA/YrhL
MKANIETTRGTSSKTLGDFLVGRDNYFDLIRLIASVLVIYSHAHPLSGSGLEDPLYRLSNGQITLGNLAVYVFFVISGLLITQSYLYSNNLMTFLKSRILRIFPGLVGVLLASTFIVGPLVTTMSLKEYLFNDGIVQYLKAVFLFPMQWNLPGVFENNAYKGVINGSLWTIPFEFICYLLVGALGFVRLLKHRYLMLLITSSSFYYFIFSSTISPAGGGHVFGLEVGTLVELTVFFLMGSLACLFKDKIYINKEITMIGIFILFISMYYGGFKPLFAIFGSYIIMYFAFLPKSIFSSITKYGDFSYGVYLYAFPIQQTVTYFYGGKTTVWINFLISVPVTFMFAIASWYLVEKNSLKLKKIKIIGESTNLRLLNPFKKALDFFENIFIYLIKMNWIKYSIYFVVFIFLFINFNSKPSIIEFPYQKSESVFHDGWLPQNSGENYRWIAGKASVELSIESNANLSIDGFVPESFKEINRVSIYLNNNKISDTELKAGEGFFLNMPVPSTNSNVDVVTIEFNAVHIPSEGDADQREMSALISKIMVTE